MSWLWGSSSSSDESQSSSKSYETDFSASGFKYDSGSSFRTSGVGFDSHLGHGSDFGSSSLGGADSEGKVDPELQTFLLMEQQKAQFQGMVHKMNDICWETCIGSPESKLSSRTETCISNCVDRFIDSTLFITNRFAQLLSKGGGVM